MNRSRVLVLAGLCSTLLAPHAHAQSPASKPKAPLENSAGSDKSAARVEADLAREGRRAQVRSLLFTLSGEARGFRDPGEGGAITLTVNSKSHIMKKTEAVPDFDIAGVFVEAARADFDQAVQLARGFKAEAPRVNAVIATSTSVLKEQGSAAPAPRAAAKD
jgi:hypothetical protein